MIISGMISGPQIVLILIILFLGCIPSLIALIDILKSKFDGNDKIVWVLVVLFFNLVGAIIYFAIGRNQRIKN